MHVNLVRDFGKWIAQRAPVVEPWLKLAYGILPSSLHDHPANFLGRYFAGFDCVKFIQIGAHNGISGDPIRPNALNNCAWSGILIEPNPLQFQLLKANYAERQGLGFKCAAVSAKSGILPFFVFNGRDLQEEFPNWWSEISSLDKNHLMHELPRAFHSCIETIAVSSVTLQDILMEIPGGKVNLITMDIEGHEPIVLQSILNSDIRPDVIMFEHKHMSPSFRLEIVGEFFSLGYNSKSYGRDTILFHAPCSQKSKIHDEFV